MGDIRLLEKIRTYDKKWCYQYQKRLDTLKDDMEKYGWTDEDLRGISLDDFEFNPISTKEKKLRKKFLELNKVYPYPKRPENALQQKEDGV